MLLSFRNHHGDVETIDIGESTTAGQACAILSSRYDQLYHTKRTYFLIDDEQRRTLREDDTICEEKVYRTMYKASWNYSQREFRCVVFKME